MKRKTIYDRECANILPSDIYLEFPHYWVLSIYECSNRGVFRKKFYERTLIKKIVFEELSDFIRFLSDNLLTCKLPRQDQVHYVDGNKYILRTSHRKYTPGCELVDGRFITLEKKYIHERTIPEHKKRRWKKHRINPKFIPEDLLWTINQTSKAKRFRLPGKRGREKISVRPIYDEG